VETPTPESLPHCFCRKRVKDNKEQEALTDQTLPADRFKLKVEVDFLKKSSGVSLESLRRRVELQSSWLSLGSQCALLGLSRSVFYYQPRGE